MIKSYSVNSYTNEELILFKRQANSISKIFLFLKIFKVSKVLRTYNAPTLTSELHVVLNLKNPLSYLFMFACLLCLIVTAIFSLLTELYHWMVDISNGIYSVAKEFIKDGIRISTITQKDDGPTT